MKYSIIVSSKGEDYGISPELHRTVSNGSKMVVNENELRLIDPDIDTAASLLGGVVMSQCEVINELNRIKSRNE